MTCPQRLIQTEANSIQEWWSSKRFDGIKRPYISTQVARLKGTFRQDYASNKQAKKLWAILKERMNSKTASFTFGALDPIQVIQMAKYLDTIYVSGWQSSSTASSSNGKNCITPRTRS